MMCPTCLGRGWLARIQVPCPECNTSGYVWPKLPLLPEGAVPSPVPTPAPAPPTFPPALGVVPWADAAD